MRIGMISQWFEPEPGAAAHPTAIARALHRRGHDLKVLTGFPSYPTDRYYDNYQVSWRQREEWDGLTLLRVPGFPSHDSSGMRRALTLGSFATCATLQVGWLRDADVCLVYLTPATVGVAARVLRHLSGVPYVLYVQDLWPESVTASGFISNARIERWMERGIRGYLRGLYRNADAVAAISPSMARTLDQRGVRERSHVVPNWVDEDIFRPADPSTRELDPGAFWVMYAGGVGNIQGLDTAIRALGMLSHRPDIRLALVGEGVAVASLRRLATDLGVAERVSFLGRRPMAAMPGLMAQADAQLVSLQDRPLFRGTIPSKLQSSMACAQPVVCAVAGDAGTVMTDSRAGIWVHPGDPTTLAGAFCAMADAPPGERSAMGARARGYYTQHLGEQVGSAALERLLTEALDRRRGRR